MSEVVWARRNGEATIRLGAFLWERATIWACSRPFAVKGMLASVGGPLAVAYQPDLLHRLCFPGSR